MAVFVRSTSPAISFVMHGDQLRDLALGDDLDVGQDLIFDMYLCIQIKIKFKIIFGDLYGIWLMVCVNFQECHRRI